MVSVPISSGDMIAVVGLNSAVDRLIDVDALVPGSVIRARTAQAWPGGKGVHAAMCVAALGEPVRLTGFVDAMHRSLFTDWLRARGVEFHPIDVAAPIRTCLAFRDAGGNITEVLEPGQPVTPDAARLAIEAVVAIGGDAPVLVLSGSAPPGVASTAYRDIASRLAQRRVLVDASGELLRHALKAAPFCIKTNRDEAEALTGTTLDSPPAAARAARALLSSGTHLVVISLGPTGAVACWERRACHISPPNVRALNPVGAGDCLMGGIATAISRGADIVEALRLGVAAGTAKVLSPETGIVRREHIDAVVREVEVNYLSVE